MWPRKQPNDVTTRVRSAWRVGCNHPTISAVWRHWFLPVCYTEMKVTLMTICEQFELPVSDLSWVSDAGSFFTNIGSAPSIVSARFSWNGWHYAGCLSLLHTSAQTAEISEEIAQRWPFLLYDIASSRKLTYWHTYCPIRLLPFISFW